MIKTYCISFQVPFVKNIRDSIATIVESKNIPNVKFPTNLNKISIMIFKAFETKSRNLIIIINRMKPHLHYFRQPRNQMIEQRQGLEGHYLAEILDSL